MSKLLCALLLAAAPAFAGDLRLFNPSDAAAAATIVCGGSATPASIAPHAIADVAGDDCSARSAAPLLVLRTGSNDGVEWQQLDAAPDDACAPAAPLFLPLNGCRFGSAVAAVTPVDGAAYSWSIDGGSILSGEGTDRILIALEGGDTLRVSAGITKGGCTTTAAAVMLLHDALQIAAFDAGKGNAGEPRTVTWSYRNGAPATQLLSGADFPQPVSLAPEARSYTFTPATPGDKEIVLQASLAPNMARSRAAGHGGGGASSCNLARAATTYHIDCTRPETNIVVPGTVSAGKPFTARVALAAGSTASWTIANGTPATATGDSVTITPNNNDPVEISVTVTTSGGCSATASAHVVIDLSGVCDNPTATVTILRNDCGAAIVEARFTGKPPFRGTWSDGTPLLASSFAVSRPVNSGTYSVTQFVDAYCAGAASNAVTLTVKAPTATLTAPKGLCSGSGATAVATFTGVPPFSGIWSDGVPFSTGATTLQRSVTSGGPLSMTFGDANCSGLQSQAINYIQSGSAELGFDGAPPSCALGGYNLGTKLAVTITGGMPPYKVTWSDGYVQQSDTSPVRRNVAADPTNGIWAITRVQDLTCDLTLTKTIVSLPYVPSPYFGYSGYSYVCAGKDSSATIINTPPAGSTIAWSITNGTITSGQGTRTVHFTPAASGSVGLTASLTTTSGCTNSWQNSITIRPLVKPAAIVVSPASGRVGQQMSISISFDPLSAYFSASSSTTDQLRFYYSLSTYDTVWTLTPSKAGNVTITAHESGYCSDSVDSSVTISVSP